MERVQQSRPLPSYTYVCACRRFRAGFAIFKTAAGSRHHLLHFNLQDQSFMELRITLHHGLKVKSNDCVTNTYIHYNYASSPLSLSLRP